MQRVPVEHAATGSGAVAERSGASGSVPRREKTISGVLPRVTEHRTWAVAGVSARPLATLPDFAGVGTARAPGTCFSSSAGGEVWLRQAGGRLATRLGDGTLLRDERGRLWIVFGGARFEVPNQCIADRLFGRAPIHVASSALAQLARLPRDGTLLREEDDARVYVMLGGTKHKVSACIDPAHVLWAGALDDIP
jgi:hypothetical protein